MKPSLNLKHSIHFEAAIDCYEEDLDLNVYHPRVITVNGNKNFSSCTEV